MKRQSTSWLWFGTRALGALLACCAIFSECFNWKFGEAASITDPARSGQFVTAFDWSVNKSKDYTWPFESLNPAPYESVLMVVEKMPRALPEKRSDKASVPLSVSCCLQVNGHLLPKPQRVTDSQKEFRVSLERGRLRFSFVLPAGFRVDSRQTLIRIKLYQ